MSTTYRVIDGDTFESIARKKYGIDSKASLIRSANPGVVEPLQSGVILVIPVSPSAPKNITHPAESNDPDEMAILINGMRFRFWNNASLTKSIDSMSTIQFSAPFQSELKDFRDNFRPLSFNDIECTIGGIKEFTGTMLTASPSIEEDSTVVDVAGYSLPGVLNDCTPSPVDATLEYNDQGLIDIAGSIAEPFGLSVVFDEDQGSIFERVACENGKKALSFLIDLANQRNLIISDNSKGDLVFLRSIESGNPVVTLDQDDSPVVSVSARFSPQNYYSHVTGVEPIATGLDGSKFTVQNERLSGVIRPFTFRAKDTQSADLKSAVDDKMGRMFGNIVQYELELDTWRDPSGNLWKDNTTIKLRAPDAMIYSFYEFLVRSVKFKNDGESKTAILTLVLPEAFKGQIPKRLPWEE